jgi:hypothetical protein
MKLRVHRTSHGPGVMAELAPAQGIHRQAERAEGLSQGDLGKPAGAIDPLAPAESAAL